MTDEIRDRIATLADNYSPRIAAERIRDQFIIMERRELPEMVAGRFGNYLVIDGQKKFAVPDCNPQVLRQIAGGLAVYAEQIESENRHDQIARELLDDPNIPPNQMAYANLSVITQRAIDRIIELEQAQQ